MDDKKKRIGFVYAINGLREVFQSELNFRLHTLSTLLVVIAGILVKLSTIEWVAVCFAIGLVLMAEVMNTAIEAIIDYVKPERHPIAKKIKDIAAAAVLIASITALVIGLIIFLPKLW
ncbi:diacylglycerol kinase family protein [Ornithinibacillus contaminans]|uniref:diacylglycerol kinase family protein n=1 Tax=Ornithinibacillus contaminans TaxID=694055 RepID=UPI00064D78D6|nr:diacylglycerol kinase family protein [Ornithinibacillus contaminans]